RRPPPGRAPGPGEGADGRRLFRPAESERPLRPDQLLPPPAGGRRETLGPGRLPPGDRRRHPPRGPRRLVQPRLGPRPGGSEEESLRGAAEGGRPGVERPRSAGKSPRPRRPPWRSGLAGDRRGGPAEGGSEAVTAGLPLPEPLFLRALTFLEELA